MRANRTFLQALRDYLHVICAAIGGIGVMFGGVMFWTARGSRLDQHIDALVVLAIGAAFLLVACLLRGFQETLNSSIRFLLWANKKTSRNENRKRGTSEASSHATPDGRFRLIHDPAGNDVVGFDGYPWRIRRDFLPGFDAEPEIHTVSQLVEALQQRRLAIAVSRINGEIEDVWLTDDPASESGQLEPGRALELRYWDGQPFHAA